MRHPISHITHRVQQVAEFVNGPDAYERLPNLDNRARELFIRAVLATPGLPKFLYRQAIQPYSQQGFDVLGIGMHAVVIRDGKESVKKFYPESRHLTEGQQLALMGSWQAKQLYNLDHLGDYALEQKFSIEPDPLNVKKSIITATQPTVDLDHPIRIGQHMSDSDAVTVAPFVKASHAMFDKTGGNAVPDVIGFKNVVVGKDGRKVHLIDTIAFTADDVNDAGPYERSVKALGIDPSKKST